MAFEEGLVTAVSDDGTATVRVARTEACEGCSSRGVCQSVGNDMEVAALNNIDAGPGDRVVVAMSTGSIVKATALLYVVPIIAMIAGAGIGEWLGPMVGVSSATAAACLSFGALGLTIWIVRGRANRLSQREQYQPRVHRVIERAVSPIR